VDSHLKNKAHTLYVMYTVQTTATVE